MMGPEMAEPTLEELISIAEPFDWAAFEAKPSGMLTLSAWSGLPSGEDLAANASPSYDFYMRVGLHFDRSMQAVISCGHFVRMRAENRWQKEYLKKIYPGQPNMCTYAHSPNLIYNQKEWEPYDLGSYISNPYSQYSIQSGHTYNTPLQGAYTGNNTLFPYPDPLTGLAGQLSSQMLPGNFPVSNTSKTNQPQPTPGFWSNLFGNIKI